MRHCSMRRNNIVWAIIDASRVWCRLRLSVNLGFGLVPHLYRKAWHALKLARIASDEHSPVGKGRGSDE